VYRGLPITRFGLDDTAAAHDAVHANTVGKVILDV
jgi:NADPH2:quinone reductase